jgi:hypothetical protein
MWLAGGPFGALLSEGQHGEYCLLAPRCAHCAGCLRPCALPVPRLRHVGVVHQDGCHPGIGLWPLLRAVLTVRVPVYSGAWPRLPSAASARLRALAPLMPCLHPRPIRLVLVSFAGGTWSLLLVLPLLSGVDSTRRRESFLLFPTGWAATACVACRAAPAAVFPQQVRFHARCASVFF